MQDMDDVTADTKARASFFFFRMAALRFNVNYVNRTTNTVEDDDMLPHVIQAPLKSHATLRLTI